MLVQMIAMVSCLGSEDNHECVSQHHVCANTWWPNREDLTLSLASRSFGPGATEQQPHDCSRAPGNVTVKREGRHWHTNTLLTAPRWRQSQATHTSHCTLVLKSPERKLTYCSACRHVLCCCCLQTI